MTFLIQLLRLNLFYVASQATVQCGSQVFANDDECPALLQVNVKRSEQQSVNEDGQNPCAGNDACGLTMGGGGLRALVAYASFTAGVMAAWDRNLDEITRDFASVGSNSGGTWFVTSLAYSPSFVQMINDMAKNPSQAQTIFNRNWVEPLLQITPAGAGTRNLGRAKESFSVCTNMLLSIMTAMEKGGITDGVIEQWDAYLSTLGFAKKKRMELEASIAMSIAEKKIDVEATKAAMQVKVNETMQEVHKAWRRLENTNRSAVSERLPVVLPKALQHNLFLQDMILMADTFATGGMDWLAGISELLYKSAGISDNLTMGSPPQSWAKGKLWLAQTSIPTPKKTNGLGSMNVWVNQNMSDLSDYVQYSASSSDESNNKFELYVPAKFSIKMGDAAGLDAKSPLPFCAITDCFNLSYDYTGQKNGASKTLQTHASSGLIGNGFLTAFESSAGKVPLTQVAGSSSAGVGFVALARPLSPMSSVCFDLTTWVTRAPGGNTGTHATDMRFALKSEPVTKESVDGLATATYGALIDGGYTDNLGIAWSVAAGRTTLLSLMNNPGNTGNLYQLFGGPMQPDGCHAPMCMISYKIFDGNWKNVRQEVDSFPSLVLPQKYKYLQGIHYGSIKATTVSNQWYGIEAGIEVTMNMVVLSFEDVSMLGLTNYHAYAEVAQEVVSTMTSPLNENALQEIAKFF